MAESDVKELIGTNAYRLPVEVVRAPNFAQGAAGRIKSSNPALPPFTFGVDRERVAVQLRALADLIDGGFVAVQDVTEVTRATLDDFTKTWLNLEFAMRLPAEEPS